jgi:hypothetical protein
LWFGCSGSSRSGWIDDRPPAPAGFHDSLNEKTVVRAAEFPDPIARNLANGERGPGRIL